MPFYDSQTNKQTQTYLTRIVNNCWFFRFSLLSSRLLSSLLLLKVIVIIFQRPFPLPVWQTTTRFYLPICTSIFGFTFKSTTTEVITDVLWNKKMRDQGYLEYKFNFTDIIFKGPFPSFIWQTTTRLCLPICDPTQVNEADVVQWPNWDFDFWQNT